MPVENFISRSRLLAVTLAAATAFLGVSAAMPGAAASRALKGLRAPAQTQVQIPAYVQGSDPIPYLDGVIHFIDPVARPLWEVTQGKIAISSLPQNVLSLPWAKQDDPQKTGTLREISYNFGESKTGDWVIENLSVGTQSQSVMTFSHGAITKWRGQVHSHPYKYVQVKDNAFSTTDTPQVFEKAKDLGVGFVWLLDSGDYYFALVVEDVAQAATYWSAMTARASAAGHAFPRDYTAKLYYSAPVGDGSVFTISTNGVMAITGKLADSGVGFYFTPKTKLGFKRLN